MNIRAHIYDLLATLGRRVRARINQAAELDSLRQERDQARESMAYAWERKRETDKLLSQTQAERHQWQVQAQRLAERLTRIADEQRAALCEALSVGHGLSWRGALDAVRIRSDFWRESTRRAAAQTFVAPDERIPGLPIPPDADPPRPRPPAPEQDALSALTEAATLAPPCRCERTPGGDCVICQLQCAIGSQVRGRPLDEAQQYLERAIGAAQRCGVYYDLPMGRRLLAAADKLRALAPCGLCDQVGPHAETCPGIGTEGPGMLGDRCDTEIDGEVP